jgi:hypothetical protein
MLKMANNGEATALATFVNNTAAQNMRLRLYTNDLVLLETMQVNDFFEASFPGYASIVLNGPNWQITPGDPSSAAYPTVAFVCTGSVLPQTIYGYYVTRDTTGDVMWAEQFGNPEIITSSGQSLTVGPHLTAKDETN